MPKVKAKRLHRCKSCDKNESSSLRLNILTQQEIVSVPFLSKYDIGAKLCNECITKSKTQNYLQENNEHDETPQSSSISNTILLNIPRTLSSTTKCFICDSDYRYTKSTRSLSLKCVSPHSRSDIFIKTGIYVPEHARSCICHMNGDDVLPELYPRIKSFSDSFHVDSKEASLLINETRSIAMQSGSRLNFDSPNTLSDTDYIRLTGITKQQFLVLESFISSVRTSSKRSNRTALAILLVKLRTGLSLSLLSTLFGLSKVCCCRAIHTVRKCLLENFVPLHLGFTHISRETIIEKHTTYYAQTLFGNQEKNTAIAVADGTYIYIEKSSNYSFQRRSFSMHKGRPLVKPMMIVATDGYILSVLGPYLADGKNNDANITKHIIQTNKENICDWFKDEDVLVVDRGFRDVLDLLNENGIRTEMPHFLPKSQKQHTEEEANESRLVTKIRWVVESANGRIKQWKALNNVIPNSQVPYIGDYVRLVCAICNAFKPALVTSAETDIVIAERMVQLSKMKNALKEKVILESWDKKRSVWEKVDQAVFDDFPRLNESELRDLTIGVYQLKQAKSYTQEHMCDEGNYEIMVHKQEEGILRAQIQSHHVSNKRYNLWIEYNQGFAPIRGWYCQCKCGSRTFGCCAHIASVLWYLGHYRHSQPNDAKQCVSSTYIDCLDDAGADDWE